jgi:two-component system sensor histidine kinase GlrK
MFRPKSIATLILIGLSVTLMPLIAAVVTAVMQVDRLAEMSRTAVQEAEDVTSQSRRLLESLTEMRRPFLQYQVTGDEDFYGLYLERRAEFAASLRNLGDRRLSGRGRAHLLELARREQALFESLTRPPQWQDTDLARRDAERVWMEVSSAAQAMLAESDASIDTYVNEMTGRADALQRSLVVQAAALIPGTILIAALFFRLVTRPLRALGGAIRRLGAHEFAEPIRVHGPRDVQELGELLDWLRQRIEQLEEQKITFLRHISHELKTPLTTIRTGSELLVEGLGERSNEEAEISRIIHANGLELQRLIEDLLRFSETQDVVTGLELSDSIDLVSIVDGVVAAHALASNAKDIAVKAELAPVSVRGDENKLKVVVDNLLSNATKYTPWGGRIHIALRAAGSCAVLDVEDTGPGVDESEVKRIFEPFQKGSAECSASVKGTGLGLSIASEYVEAHDGHIRVVASTTGAHFRVSIPIAGPRGVRKVSRARDGRSVLVGV